MEQVDKKQARYKIDINNSQWKICDFAVYEKVKVLGFSVWQQIKVIDTIEKGRAFIEEKMKLPEYY